MRIRYTHCLRFFGFFFVLSDTKFMATDKQVLQRDSSRIDELLLFNDDCILFMIIQLPQKAADIVQSYFDKYLWNIAKLINAIKKLPSEVLKIIKLYSRIGAFGSHYETICELKYYHQSVQLWLSQHKPRYKICPHCAGYVEILPINLLCPCQNTMRFKKLFQEKNIE